MELSDEIHAFIMPEPGVTESYSHRTFSQEVADKIMKEGFRFTDSFQKTTDHIIDDLVYLRYWDSLRKHYGGYVIILMFSKEIIEKITARLNPKSEVQQALSKRVKGSIEDAEDTAFLLPKQFVKGYLVRETGEIHANPDFDPYYMPPGLLK